MNSIISSGLTARKRTVGYRFHPTDAELVGHFLKQKIRGIGNDEMPIADVKVCDFDPWELPGHSKIKSDNETWYFFCSRDLKYSNSNRVTVNRTTKSGCWKSTGKHRNVKRFGTKKVIGIKKTLVFRKKGDVKKTEWIMHEYEHIPQGTYVVCKLKTKSNGKISKCKQNEMASPSDTITANSSCGECESGDSMLPDFESLNLEKVNALSNGDKGEQSCLVTFDFENLSENEVTTSSACYESESCQHFASDFEDHTLSWKVKSCFKSQNSDEKTNLLVSVRNERSSLVAASDCGIQDPHEKADMSNPSVAAGVELNAMEASILEIQGPRTFFDDLKTLTDPEGSLNFVHSRL